MSRRPTLILRTLLIVASGSVFLAGAAAQPVPAGERLGLYGYVLAPDGTPVSDGSVVIRSGFRRQAASIDQAGRFRLVPERSGLQELHVSVPGLAPHRIDVDVPPSRTIEIPGIRLSPPTYVRLRPVSATGEVLGAPRIARRSLYFDGSPADTPAEIVTDSEGVITLGPLPRGVTMMALDSPPLALTRVPDIRVTGAEELIDAGTVLIDLGAALHVDVVDAAGAPIAGHDVFLEDVRPLSPLSFQPARTSPQGRATFQRLAAGQYRVRTRAAGRCGGQTLMTGRVIAVPGRGAFNIRIVAGGTANLRLSTRFGALPGVAITLTPDVGPPKPLAFFSEASCSGSTNADGTVVLRDVPPGPARIDVRFPNSRYTRRVTTSEDGREVPVQIPDGLMQLSVSDAVTKRPVSGATISWSSGGARVEARTTGSGDALLEAVAPAPGTLTVSASGYESIERQFGESPDGNYEATLTPAPPAVIEAHVGSDSAQPLPHAVVRLSHESRGGIERIVVADPKGVARFPGAGAGTLEVTARAEGFATATSRISENGRGHVALTLSRGFRLLVSVELPREAGPQLIRVLSGTGRPLDDLLDFASDRRTESSGSASIGPLPPGDYIVEVRGGKERRRARVAICDADVSVTIRP
jgi:hypothetical protein